MTAASLSNAHNPEEEGEGEKEAEAGGSERVQAERSGMEWKGGREKRKKERVGGREKRGKGGK